MREPVQSEANPEQESERGKNMSRIIRWLRVGFVAAVVLANCRVTAGRAFAAELPPASACEAPAYRQFDFWAGDWDVFDVGSPVKVAHAQVDLILNACVLRENYESTDGLRGQSFTIYDAGRNVWHQSWVTNRGALVLIEGKVEANEMILGGEDYATGSLVRGTWKPIDGGVRETAVRSLDGGKSWQPWFDLMFRPQRPAAGGMADDQKQVAALDTKYQAAVKNHDVVAMDLLLADDFVLVTGSGKIYTKNDLLNETRSGRIQYERQDDSEQMVRIWANTALITAKLREKGIDGGKPFDYTLWFSDTYVRTPLGWKYVFGQASRPLPNSEN